MLTQTARKLLPAGAARSVEEVYRKNRVRLISAFYGNPARNLRVLAVTGTNGKTTTVSYINQILKKAGHTTAMFSTALIEVAGKAQLNDLNATVGSTARMQQFFRAAARAKTDFVVLEVTSHALHQHKLATVPIEAAVMTNLTQDHLDYHKTMKAYAAAKGILFANRPKYIVLNRDDDWFEFFDTYTASTKKITYGTSDESEAHIDHIKLLKNGNKAQITIDHQTKLELTTILPGKYNIYNMTAAAALTHLLGVGVSDIQDGVANLKGVPGRFERVVEGLPYEVIVDYAHTPDALEKLLEAARAITKNRVILVFGATGDRDKGKRPIMGGIAAQFADHIFLTDDESYNEDPKAIRDQVYAGIVAANGADKTVEVGDRYDAIKKALALIQMDDTVLITGMGHEQFRIVGGKRLPWNDAAVVREILK